MRTKCKCTVLIFAIGRNCRNHGENSIAIGNDCYANEDHIIVLATQHPETDQLQSKIVLGELTISVNQDNIVFTNRRGKSFTMSLT